MTDEQRNSQDPVTDRADELTQFAQAASRKLDANAPRVNRVYAFLRDRKQQNGFGLEFELSLTRRGA